MHRESYGSQDLHFHYFEVKDIVRDLFADSMTKGQQHLYFRRYIGQDGKRRFTDAHTCLAFEQAASQIGDGVVYFFFDFVPQRNMPMEKYFCMPCIHYNPK